MSVVFVSFGIVCLGFLWGMWLMVKLMVEGVWWFQVDAGSVMEKVICVCGVSRNSLAS